MNYEGMDHTDMNHKGMGHKGMDHDDKPKVTSLGSNLPGSRITNT
jgi:uncharacterized protein involved in copper resistance